MDLATQSRASRGKSRPSKSFGDPLAAQALAYGTKILNRLARMAVSLAAAERKRHGREASPEDRADAMQDVLLHVYADLEPGEPVDLDALVDPDHPRMATPDGDLVTDRPCPELVAAAGASLDKAHRHRELLDPEAGTGLLTQSAQSRDRGEALRSCAAQVVDPAASPVPPEVAEAIDGCGLWPDDPMRQAILTSVCPELTAQDWIEAGVRAKTPAAIWQRVKRGKAALAADPKARTFAALLEAEIEPTDAERAEAKRQSISHLLAAAEVKQPKCHLPDRAWRITQPRIYPIRTIQAEAV